MDTPTWLQSPSGSSWDSTPGPSDADAGTNTVTATTQAEPPAQPPAKPGPSEDLSMFDKAKGKTWNGWTFKGGDPRNRDNWEKASSPGWMSDDSSAPLNKSGHSIADQIVHTMDVLQRDPSIMLHPGDRNFVNAYLGTLEKASAIQERAAATRERLQQAQWMNENRLANSKLAMAQADTQRNWRAAVVDVAKDSDALSRFNEVVQRKHLTPDGLYRNERGELSIDPEAQGVIQGSNPDWNASEKERVAAKAGASRVIAAGITAKGHVDAAASKVPTAVALENSIEDAEKKAATARANGNDDEASFYDTRATRLKRQQKGGDLSEPKEMTLSNGQKAVWIPGSKGVHILKDQKREAEAKGAFEEYRQRRSLLTADLKNSAAAGDADPKASAKWGAIIQGDRAAVDDALKKFHGLWQETRQEPPASPAATTKSTARIRVKSKDGKLGTIPADQLDDALNAGYQKAD